MNVIAEKLRQAYHNDLGDVPILLDGADEIDSLIKERDRLREALKGLVGLVQLVRSRDDCPIEIKQALTDHYRLDDALAALAKEAQ